ncbi:hypothetical protein [Brevibacterium sp.]|uniref:hypothetical protein n=1 Tax=Brevibacterium sp. TaxID=1701 RepID=UPI002810B404|nr:hypothetical protein [Brevibacterium sp.]
MRRAIRRARPFLRAVACGICFGLVGLVWSAPRFRRRRLRRAATCGVCASHMRVRNVAVLVVAVLLVAGAAARPLEAATSPLLCHSHITADGSVRPEPSLRIAPPTPWQVTRDFLVAPISGVGVLAGRAMGMESCSGPPLLVMFWPPPRTSSGGTTLGDVFVAWMPGEPTSGPATVNGYGNEGHRLYMRYGPNISGSREDEAELGLHESRHVDQWAVTNLVAGPFAFPTAYFIDNSLFPRSRNHFERDAGLSGGHYPPAPDNLPAPRWPDAMIVIALGLLIFRRRLRWSLRVLQDPSSQRSAHEPGRCPVHTRGLRPIGHGTA